MGTAGAAAFDADFDTVAGGALFVAFDGAFCGGFDMTRSTDVLIQVCADSKVGLETRGYGTP